MGRLQHLAGVERMRVGIVIVQAVGGFGEDGGGGVAERGRRTGRQMREACVEPVLRFAETREKLCFLIGLMTGSLQAVRLSTRGFRPVRECEEAEFYGESGYGCEQKRGRNPIPLRCAAACASPRPAG